MIDKLISIKVAADVSALKKGMAEATSSMDKVKKASGKLGDALGKAGNVAGKVGGAIKGAFKVAAVGVVAAGGAIAGTVMDTVGKMDEIDKASQRSLMSAEAYQEWAYVFGQNGIEATTLESAQKKLTKTMAAAGEGGKKQNAAMKELGLSYSDLNKMSPEERFNAVVASLQGVTNESDKARLAQEMFGGNAAKMAPLLNQTAEGTAALKDNIHDLGGVMSDEAVAAGAHLNDTIDDVKQAFGGLMSKIGVEFMPIIQALLDWVLAHMPQIQQVINKVFEVLGIVVNGFIEVLKTFHAIFVGVMDIFAETSVVSGDVFAGFGEIVSGVMTAIDDFLNGPVREAIMNFAQLIADNLPAIQEVFERVFGVVADVLSTVIDNCAYLVQSISGMSGSIEVDLAVIGDIFEKVGEAINFVVINISSLIGELLLPIIMDIVNFVVANVPWISSVFSDVFSAVEEVVDNVFFPAMDAVMGVVDTVWSIFLAAWPAIQTIIKVAFDYIKTVYNSILKPVFGFIVELVNKLKAKFDEHMPAIKKIFEAFGTTIKNVWIAIKPVIEAIGKVIKWLFDKFMEYIWPLVSLVIDWFFKIAGAMAEKMEWASSKLGPIIEGIAGFFGGIADTVKSVLGFFDDIKDGIVEKIEWAKEKVGNLIQGIKDFFNFNFTWPKLSMPKFSITGSMNPVKWLKEGVPKLSVSWNARGAIFKKPTILANGQGVGDASNGHGSSPEVVAPLSDLKQMLGLNDNKGNITINLNGNYSFRDKADMDYLMNQMALKMRRA